MFNNLIESSSHQKDLARKGRFFLATLISYSLIVTCAGVFSIYAYDAHLEEQELEFIGLVNPDQMLPVTPPNRNTERRAASNPGERSTPAQRTEFIDRVSAPTIIPNDVSSVGSDVPELPKSGPVIIGPVNIDGTSVGPPSSDGTGGNSDGGPGSVVRIVTPPPVRETPAAAQPKVVRKSILLNGEAKYLPKPIYPIIAKRIGVSGPVNVQVMIDESGKVVSARATSGNPLLYSAATQAAYQARFSPTVLNESAVKVSGIIVYNFLLQ